jgi:hypothetical protein
MEFLKLCQKYFNRYLNAEDFLKNLKALDKDLNKNEKASFDALTTSVEEIIRETNDDSDELIEQELKQLEASIKQIDDILKKRKRFRRNLRTSSLVCARTLSAHATTSTAGPGFAMPSRKTSSTRSASTR